MEPTAENTIDTTKTPITPNEFQSKYWFSNEQLVTVLNPKSEDFPFMVEMRNFMIKAGRSEKFPGFIANVYLNLMSKILAQDEDRLELMSDPNLMRHYFDRLIVTVESLVKEHNPLPDYMTNVPKHTIVEADNDTPPWQQDNIEPAGAVTPVAPPPPQTPLEPQPKEEEPVVAKAEPTTKEFELDGSKYKMVVNKSGNEMYYKNGKMTSASDYAKAASML